MDRVLKGAVAVLVVLFFSCAAGSMSERRGDGTFVLEYRTKAGPEVVTASREDALGKAKDECRGKDVRILKEWDVGWLHRIEATCHDRSAEAATVLARVKVETGCEQLSVLASAVEGPTSSYRVDACGTQLVCELDGHAVKCRKPVAQ